MTNGAKTALIIAVVFIVLGAVIALAALSMGNFNRSDLAVQYSTRTVTPYGAFEDISIHTAAHDVTLAPSHDGVCRVEVDESSTESVSVEVSGGTLAIKTHREHKLFSFTTHPTTPRITLYLPQSEYRALNLNTASGDVRIPRDFSFESLEISTASGDTGAETNVTGALKIGSASGEIYFSGSANSAAISAASGDIEFYGSVAGTLEIGSASGDITLRGSAAELDAHTASGELELEEFTASGKAKLNSTSGEISLDRCDAGEFDIDSTSGDVRGSLLSGKVFKCSSTSGDIRVPNDYPGGNVCRVHTTSGDIRITVE